MAFRVVGVLGVGLVDAAVPVIHADDLGLVRGDGCFETLRVSGGTAHGADAHLARLARSAARLDLPAPDPEPWRDLVAEMIAAWDGPDEAMLRLVLTRGVDGSGVPTAVATMAPIPDGILRQRREGVRVITLTRGLRVDEHRAAPWLLAGAKLVSYAVNMAALRHAHSVGADDAIFLSSTGAVLEGPTATVVWARGRRLHTIPAEHGILEGTTVRALFDQAGEFGFQTAVEAAEVADLHDSDDVWLVSSVRGAARVTTLDGKSRPDSGHTENLRRALLQGDG